MPKNAEIAKELIADFLNAINWPDVSEKQLGLITRIGPRCSGINEAIAMVLMGMGTLRVHAGFTDTQTLLTALACIEHIKRSPDGIAVGQAIVAAMEGKGTPS